MPSNPPMTSAAPRDPKRVAPIPAKVRAACLLLVHGDATDEECKSLTLVEAARMAGLQPDQFRRWLDRAQVKRFVRAERKIALDALSAGNPSALERVRGGSNPMASVRAAMAIEELRSADDAAPGGFGGGLERQAPGVVIYISRDGKPPKPGDTLSTQPPTIEARPLLGAPPAVTYSQGSDIEREKPAPRHDDWPIFRP
jgi:hypothetical protein